MGDFLKRVANKRLEGDRPSVPQALATASVVGAGAAVVVYKLLRS